MTSSDNSPFLTLGLSQPEAVVSEPELASWTLEPELAAPIPRPTLLRRDYYIGQILGPPSFMLFALAIQITLGLIFGPIGIVQVKEVCTIFLPIIFAFAVMTFFFVELERRSSRKFVQRGTPTRGMIVERKWISGHKSGHWRHSIAYETPVRRVTHSSLGDNRKVGETLTVLYLPESPERAMLYEHCCYEATATLGEATELLLRTRGTGSAAWR